MCLYFYCHIQGYAVKTYHGLTSKFKDNEKINDEFGSNGDAIICCFGQDSRNNSQRKCICENNFPAPGQQYG
ncbi:hypothetical protein D3C81_1948720 [compost metagenome]